MRQRIMTYRRSGKEFWSGVLAGSGPVPVSRTCVATDPRDEDGPAYEFSRSDAWTSNRRRPCCKSFHDNGINRKAEVTLATALWGSLRRWGLDHENEGTMRTCWHCRLLRKRVR